MAEPTAPTLTVTLQLTTHPTQPTPSLHALTLARTSSIKDLKTRLSNEWDGKPAVEGIVCVLGGRVCRDSDVLGDMFPESTLTRPLLHIIVKGSAWTVLFTAPPALPSVYAPLALPPPTPTPTPILATPLDDPPALPGYTPSYLTPIPPAPSLGPSVSGYLTYPVFLSQLIPLQRALLLLNTQKALLSLMKRYSKEIMVGRLSGKVALITGGSTGIGRGIALRFASEGAKVAIFDLSEKQLEGNFDGEILTTSEAIRKAGGEAEFYSVDSTADRSLTTAAMASVVSHWGKVDIFVPCAGVYCPLVPFHEQTLETLDRCYSIQTRGSYMGSQEAVKVMLKQASGGSIVQLVSTAGLGAHPNGCPYDMSKAAQAQLTKCIASEYGPNKIRCNGIFPTYLKTALTAQYHADPSFRDMFAKSIPLRRWGEVTDVTHLAVYLASDESSFMTGELIRVDGGELLGRFTN